MLQGEEFETNSPSYPTDSQLSRDTFGTVIQQPRSRAFWEVGAGKHNLEGPRCMVSSAFGHPGESKE